MRLPLLHQPVLYGSKLLILECHSQDVSGTRYLVIEVHNTMEHVPGDWLTFEEVQALCEIRHSIHIVIIPKEKI